MITTNLGPCLIKSLRKIGYKNDDIPSHSVTISFLPKRIAFSKVLENLGSCCCDINNELDDDDFWLFFT